VLPDTITVERARPWAILRVRQWVHFLPLPAAGVSLARGREAPLGALAAAILVAALALGYAYGLNAISDRVTDLDARKNPLAGVGRCPREASWLVALVALFALAAGALTGALPAVLVSLAAATVYSIGPRLKRWPAIGTLLNVCMFAPLLSFARASGPVPAPFALYAIVFVALLLQNQLLHEQADASEDAAAVVLTTARWAGPTMTRVLVAAIGLAGVALAAAIASSRAQAAAAIVALAAGTIAGTRPRLEWRRARLAHRVVAIAGGAALYVVGLWA
jgi:4-hydroxybenzoate polyprenyltransferase